MMTLITRSAALALTLLASAGQAASFRDFSSLLVFGDSLSDPGNLKAATGGLAPDPADYPSGRFSDGPVWSEYFAQNFTASANFAFGGAKATTDADAIPDFAAQRALYQGRVLAGFEPGARPLAAVWFGANDLFAALRSDPAAAPQAVSDALGGIGAGVSALRAAGVSDFLLFNLPDIGLTPSYSGDAASAAAASAISDAFNSGLSQFAGEGVEFVDATRFLRSLQTTSLAFSPACLATPDRDCSGLVFYDGVHPTNAVHAAFAESIAARYAAPVPLPAGGALLLGGLAAFGLLRRLG